MGWYQWQLFLVVGFGWASDNMWPMVTSLILIPIANEFAPSHPALLTLCQNIGLLAGAVFWGFGCDIMGRKTAFNYTLGLATIFGLSAALCHNFASVGCMVAFWSFGVGGNLPVDSAIFLEFLPASHQYLLTVLSVDWAFAQLFVNIIAWPVLTKFSCEQHEGCLSGDNLGWRWLLMAVGGASLLMLFARFFLFTVHESPKYLVGVGLEEDAVAVIHEIARVNRRYTSLTIEDLKACEPDDYVDNDRASHVIHRRLLTVGVGRVRKLFGTKRLAFSTGLVMAIWSLIGLAYPLYNAFLPYIQATRGIEFGDGSNNITFRNSMIIAVLGVPGALMGAYLVEKPHIGRKGTLALSTAMTGTFLYGSASAKNSTSLLGWNCGFSLAGNIMNAVLYSFTPELFPTPQRGTGNALAAMCNRLFGIAAVGFPVVRGVLRGVGLLLTVIFGLQPVIAIYGNVETAIPVYTSGALFVVAGLLVMLLPFESRGRAAL